MEVNLADALVKSCYEGLLGNVDVGARWFGRFGLAVKASVGALRRMRWGILFGNLALAVIEPVHLPGTELPLFSKHGLKLWLGEARGQASAYKLQTRRLGFWAAGR